METVINYDRYRWMTRDCYRYWWRFNPRGCAHRILNI